MSMAEHILKMLHEQQGAITTIEVPGGSGRALARLTQEFKAAGIHVASSEEEGTVSMVTVNVHDEARANEIIDKVLAEFKSQEDDGEEDDDDDYDDD